MYENLEAQAGRLLFLAYVLLGDFLAFDWHLGGILENGEYFSFEKKELLVVVYGICWGYTIQLYGDYSKHHCNEPV